MPSRKIFIFFINFCFVALSIGGSLNPPWAPVHSYEALRSEPPAETAGLEELKARLGGRSPTGLEERFRLSHLIAGWESFEVLNQRRLADQLRRTVDRPTLERLVDYVQNPVTPPDTLYQIMGQILVIDQAGAKDLVESLGPEAYQPPITVDVGRSIRLLGIESLEVRPLMEETVFVIAAGGGGDRFKRSLPKGFKKQLGRHGRLEKPAVMIGPSGTSPVVRTLEEIFKLAKETGARNVYVIVVTGLDSRAAVRKNLKDNGWLGREQKRIRPWMEVVEIRQPSYPSFDPNTGKILTAKDPRTGRIEILYNPNGTYGPFATAYRKAQQEGFGEGKSWLILYGDDPILNTAELIRRILIRTRYLDVVSVAVSKQNRSTPPGGTMVDLVLPEPYNRRIHLIVEEKERNPDPEKGIPGLPAFNDKEDEETAKGADPFPFSTGPLKLSEKAAAAATSVPPLRHADRSGVRKLELFLTHIPTVIGNQEGMKYAVLQVDAEQYGSAKDFAGVVRAVEKLNRQSHQQLPLFPGAGSVTFGKQIYLEIRPGFSGFRVGSHLHLDMPAGVVLGPDGITVVPIKSFEKVTLEEPDPNNPTQTVTRIVQHPIFDLEKAVLMFTAGADGLIGFSGYIFNGQVGLEEEFVGRRVNAVFQPDWEPAVLVIEEST